MKSSVSRLLDDQHAMVAAWEKWVCRHLCWRKVCCSPACKPPEKQTLSEFAAQSSLTDVPSSQARISILDTRLMHKSSWPKSATECLPFLTRRWEDNPGWGSAMQEGFEELPRLAVLAASRSTRLGGGGGGGGGGGRTTSVGGGGVGGGGWRPKGGGWL